MECVNVLNSFLTALHVRLVVVFICSGCKLLGAKKIALTFICISLNYHYI